jgi:hypothetical protein
MAEKKRVPLDELLFGAKSDLAAKPEADLAQVVSAWYRESLASSLRGQIDQRASLPEPRGEPNG